MVVATDGTVQPASEVEYTWATWDSAVSVAVAFEWVPQ
jgi:hypothetical protein